MLACNTISSTIHFLQPGDNKVGLKRDAMMNPLRVNGPTDEVILPCSSYFVKFGEEEIVFKGSK